MDNPVSILIVLIPAYLVLSLLTAVLGAGAAPLLHQPRSRFFLGFALSLVALPAALLLHTLGLAALSYVPGLDSPLTHRSETAIVISLVIFLLAGLIAAYYCALRWRRHPEARGQT